MTTKTELERILKGPQTNKPWWSADVAITEILALIEQQQLEARIAQLEEIIILGGLDLNYNTVADRLAQLNSDKGSQG